jgi:hypothetical protein
MLQAQSGAPPDVFVLDHGGPVVSHGLRVSHVHSQLSSCKVRKIMRLVAELPSNAMGKVQKSYFAAVA